MNPTLYGIHISHKDMVIHTFLVMPIMRNDLKREAWRGNRPY